jgi:AraC family transcriptional regulator of adaptative response / DNA-3-methyladenine glycosylase II
MLSSLQTRDARFDGLLFVGVTSTGVYCRPVCPARTPQFQYCRFFGSAAAAQEAGFRPCLRCRPETAPDLASWRGTSNTVSRPLAFIADGALDSDEGNVVKLSERLDEGERQLRRLFEEHLGASPIAVAQTRRVLFAKQLIHETRMPMTEIALAAGFGSLRRFHEVFHNLFRRPPSALRRDDSAGSVPAKMGVTLRLRYRQPYDWDSMLAYLKPRAIPGVEVVEEDSYQRTVEMDGYVGFIKLRTCLGSTAWESRSISQMFVRCPQSWRESDGYSTRVPTSEPLTNIFRASVLARLVAQRPGLRAVGHFNATSLRRLPKVRDPDTWLR